MIMKKIQCSEDNPCETCTLEKNISGVSSELCGPIEKNESPKWQELMDKLKALEYRIQAIESHAYVIVNISKESPSWHGLTENEDNS